MEDQRLVVPIHGLVGVGKPEGHTTEAPCSSLAVEDAGLVLPKQVDVLTESTPQVQSKAKPPAWIHLASNR